VSLGLQYLPLTATQKSRLDSHGERIWTEKEKKIIHENVVIYDKLRIILKRRCAGCQYVISSLETCMRLPFIGDVCDVCYHMHEALQNHGLKDFYYFRTLHNEWIKSQDPDEQRRRRDKMGL